MNETHSEVCGSGTPLSWNKHVFCIKTESSKISHLSAFTARFVNRKSHGHAQCGSSYIASSKVPYYISWPLTETSFVLLKWHYNCLQCKRLVKKVVSCHHHGRARYDVEAMTIKPIWTVQIRFPSTGATCTRFKCINDFFAAVIPALMEKVVRTGWGSVELNHYLSLSNQNNDRIYPSFLYQRAGNDSLCGSA